MTIGKWVALGVAVLVLLCGCTCCGWIACVHTLEVAESESSYVERVDPIALTLSVGGTPDPAAIRELARDRVARAYLMDVLDEYARFDLMPLEFTTNEACAEADLARWLTYPTELDAAPSSMEVAAHAYVDDPVNGPLVYVAFRFTAPAGHWASGEGWMFGISGPWPMPGAPRRPDLAMLGTYSELTPYSDAALRAMVASLHEQQISHAPLSPSAIRVEIVPLR